MKMPTEAEMRAEFHRLQGVLAEGMEKLQPLIDAYEKKHAEITQIEQTELKPLADKVKAAREGLGLHEVQKTIAQLNRVLKGETGADPTKTDDQTIDSNEVGKLPA